MKNEPIRLIITLAIICGLILAGTLYAYYRSSLIHISGTLDKDFFPAFGSFISGTVGLILSIVSVILIYSTYQTQQRQLEVTRGLVDRQISLSIKPELVVEDFESSSYNPEAKPMVIDNKPEEDGILPIPLKKVPLRILNVGIEAAKYIQYNFEYDIDAVIAYMDSHLEKPVLKFEYNANMDWAKITHLETQKAAGISIKSEKRKMLKDYLMPYKLTSDFIEVTFPMAYLLYYYYVMMNEFKPLLNPNSDNTSLEKFPPCYLTVVYRDLEGKAHKKKFDVKLIRNGWGFFFGSPKSAKAQAYLNIKFTSNEMDNSI